MLSQNGWIEESWSARMTRAVNLHGEPNKDCLASSIASGPWVPFNGLGMPLCSGSFQILINSHVSQSQSKPSGKIHVLQA